jgi:protein-L-isoaspartate(D-aspartate) O-methyltransferase
MANDDSDPASRRRNTLTDKLKRDGIIRSATVEAAFRAVPRHVFVPQAALWRAYADEALPLKKEGEAWLSSISQPAMVALMLEQLELCGGQHVLEIGAGAGYNAALMAHIVGEAGHVVTLDIDDDLVQAARAHLLIAGVTNVTAITADGALGHPADAPYDRVILTVGATDIAPAWRDQLVPGGRLVLPIDFTGQGMQFSIAFDEVHGVLIGRSFEPCGFIKLRGALAPEQPQPSASTEPPAPRPSSFGELIAGSLSQLLPNVGHELWRRRMNRQVFGRPALAGLNLRAYPVEVGFAPVQGEVVHDRAATRFVVGWTD